MAAQFRPLDRAEGEIDALSSRLAGVRTLAYVAHRPDWLVDPGHWQERTRALEDRLSDRLHERLMARFVDRRTSALLRGLAVPGELLAGVAADGAVTVEGHLVGRLQGVRFEPARALGELERKALRGAAEKAVRPEIDRRLGALAADADDSFALTQAGEVLWRGEMAGVLTGGGEPLSPRVRLLGELGHEVARARAGRRLEAFVAAEAARRLAPLRRLVRAVAEGQLEGLARGVAWRLAQSGGTVARSALAGEVAALSRAERRALRSFGVSIGEHALFLAALREPRRAAFAGALAAAAPAEAALGLRGLVEVDGQPVDAVALERLAGILRAAPREKGGRRLDPDSLPFAPADALQLLQALGWRPAGGDLWRRARAPAPKAAKPAPTTASPFAALSALRPTMPRRRRVRRRA
jgi:ATP-dependent RNA helicase SUPV3L1/SUV3